MVGEPVIPDELMVVARFVLAPSAQEFALADTGERVLAIDDTGERRFEADEPDVWMLAKREHRTLTLTG